MQLIKHLEQLFKKLLTMLRKNAKNALFIIGSVILLWWLLRGYKNKGPIHPLYENFTDADLKTGTKVHLKTGGGKYLSVCKGSDCGSCCLNNLCLEDENKGDSSTFEIYVHSERDKKISLKALTANYLFECEGCCGDKCSHIICADSTNVNSENGIFTLVETEERTLLRAHNGKIVQLCTNCNDKCRLLCAKELEELNLDNLSLELVVA